MYLDEVLKKIISDNHNCEPEHLDYNQMRVTEHGLVVQYYPTVTKSRVIKISWETLSEYSPDTYDYI